jgi:hypothetical protein
METPDDVTGPVKLGNPVEFTIRQLAETVIALTGSSSDRLPPLPKDDPRQRCPDISLAKELLDWAPAVQSGQKRLNISIGCWALKQKRAIASSFRLGENLPARSKASPLGRVSDSFSRGNIGGIVTQKLRCRRLRSLH